MNRTGKMGRRDRSSCFRITNSYAIKSVSLGPKAGFPDLQHQAHSHQTPKSSVTNMPGGPLPLFSTSISKSNAGRGWLPEFLVAPATLQNLRICQKRRVGRVQFTKRAKRSCAHLTLKKRPGHRTDGHCECPRLSCLTRASASRQASRQELGAVVPHAGICARGSA